MFAWGDYLSLARFLVRSASATGTEEAARRSAVSRAYYASFCLARAWAASRPLEPFAIAGTADHHRSLRNWLRRNGHDAEAQQLERLREWRNQCDYNDVLRLRLDTVSQQSIVTAEQMLHSLGIGTAR